MTSNRRLFVASLVTAALSWCIFTVGYALAGYAASTTDYNLAYDGTYYDFAAIETCSGCYTYGYTNVGSKDGAFIAPTGHMGGRAAIWYASDGSLCNRSGWVYNGHPYSGFGITITPGCGLNTNYNSRGGVQLWNGFGYDSYYTNRSPNQSS